MRTLMAWLLALAAMVSPLRAAEGLSADRFQAVDEMYFQRHLDENLEKTITILEEMAAKDPGDAEALWRLGRSLVRRGEKQSERQAKIASFSRAEKIIGGSVAIDSKIPEAHFWHGLALGRNGETRGVMRSLFMIGPLRRRMHLVLELDPKHGGAHHVLGRMLFQLPFFAGGSKTEAVAELETALRLSPAFTAHYPALAEAYLSVGRKQDARRVLKAFYDVSQPSDPAVYEEHRVQVETMTEALRP